MKSRVLFFLSLSIWFFGAPSNVMGQGGGREKAQSPGWPSGWIEAYDRFESFIREREQNWPKSNLEITEDGQVIHEVPLVKDAPYEHLTLDIFKQEA